MNRSAWQFEVLPELGELASQLAHPMHDRLAAGSEPAACEANRVTQLAEGSVVVEGFGRTGLPDCFERTVNPSDNRRLSVYPQLEVELSADVCPSAPMRDVVDQGRDGRITWAGSRSE